MPRRLSRATVFGLGAIVIAVGVGSLFFVDEIRVRRLVRGLDSEPDLVLAYSEFPPESPERRAAEEFLRSERGRRRALERFVALLLETPDVFGIDVTFDALQTDLYRATIWREGELTKRDIIRGLDKHRSGMRSEPLDKGLSAWWKCVEELNIEEMEMPGAPGFVVSVTPLFEALLRISKCVDPEKAPTISSDDAGHAIEIRSVRPLAEEQIKVLLGWLEGASHRHLQIYAAFRLGEANVAESESALERLARSENADVRAEALAALRAIRAAKAKH